LIHPHTFYNQLCTNISPIQGFNPMDDNLDITRHTANIVSAYVANNAVASGELSNLVHNVTKSLHAAVTEAEEPPKPVPAVSIKKSVQPEFLICLEDGRKFKSLKRHLRTYYNLTPEEYRDKWDLPRDYPMVAPDYAARRSQLAKKIGLGRKGRKKA